MAFNKLEEFLSNKSFFGSLKSDMNLTWRGNIVLGEGDDKSEEDNLVFEDEPPPSEEESNGKDSNDKDAPTQIQETPYNLIVPFGCQVIWHGNKRKQHMSMPLQVGRYASWKMSKKMFESDWQECIVVQLRR